MKHFRRLTIALLALLTISATAWAQTETLLVTINASSDFTSGSKTFDNAVTATFSGEVTYSDHSNGYTTYNETTLTVAAANDGYTVTRVKFFTTLGDAEDTTAPFEASLKSVRFYNELIDEYDTAVQVLVNGNSIGAETSVNYLTKIEVYGIAPASGPEVTINDTKDEASFEMPQNDVTVTYSLKRDMAVDMAVSVKDEQQNSRFRVQKQGNDFVPVGLTNAQVMALFNVRDQIEEADLTATTDYTVQIFAADKDGKPTGTAMTFATFTYAPGQYIVKAVAAEGSNYVGKTALSNVFTLFQGYEIVVAAGEYATYYKDEALYVEDEDAKLYTITAVNGDKATATELTTAPANMPILVQNTSTETKTILLIPTSDRTPDVVSAADEFKGTLEARTFTAEDMQAADYYVSNGHDFVWVKGAGTIAANRCWIEISKVAAAPARRLTISFGDQLTGIESVISDKEDANWYDLNGRRLDSKPAQKGLFIRNGRKVVVK